MSPLIQAAQLILALTILVFIHELGHFLAARMFGVKVEKFYIFFDAWGKKIWSFKRGDTEYGIGWLPLGGYVKIAGMIDESLDKEQMKSEPQPWELRAKPNWQKFIVMIAGIVMNVILGVILYIIILHRFTGDYLPVSSVNNDGGIYATEAGMKYGFQTGDKLVSINGKSFERYEDFESARLYFGSDVVVDRNGSMQTINVPDSAFRDKMRGQSLIDVKSIVIVNALSDTVHNAKDAGMMKGDTIVSINGADLICVSQMMDLFRNSKDTDVRIGVKRTSGVDTLSAHVNKNGQLGFEMNVKLYAYDTLPYTFGKSLSYGTRDAFEVFYFQAVSVWRIIRGDIPARDSISSPIGIAKLFSENGIGRLSGS
ncbi:MAG: RIP metalloprotease RseP [Chitinophagales bacterium]